MGTLNLDNPSFDICVDKFDLYIFLKKKAERMKLHHRVIT